MAKIQDMKNFAFTATVVTFFRNISSRISSVSSRNKVNSTPNPTKKAGFSSRRDDLEALNTPWQLEAILAKERYGREGRKLLRKIERAKLLQEEEDDEPAVLQVPKIKTYFWRTKGQYRDREGDWTILDGEASFDEKAQGEQSWWDREDVCPKCLPPDGSGDDIRDENDDHDHKKWRLWSWNNVLKCLGRRKTTT